MIPLDDSHGEDLSRILAHIAVPALAIRHHDDIELLSTRYVVLSLFYYAVIDVPPYAIYVFIILIILL